MKKIKTILTSILIISSFFLLINLGGKKVAAASSTVTLDLKYYDKTSYDAAVSKVELFDDDFLGQYLSAAFNKNAAWKWDVADSFWNEATDPGEYPDMNGLSPKDYFGGYPWQLYGLSLSADLSTADYYGAKCPNKSPAMFMSSLPNGLISVPPSAFISSEKSSFAVGDDVAIELHMTASADLVVYTVALDLTDFGENITATQHATMDDQAGTPPVGTSGNIAFNEMDMTNTGHPFQNTYIGYYTFKMKSGASGTISMKYVDDGAICFTDDNLDSYDKPTNPTSFIVNSSITIGGGSSQSSTAEIETPKVNSSTTTVSGSNYTITGVAPNGAGNAIVNVVPKDNATVEVKYFTSVPSATNVTGGKEFTGGTAVSGTSNNYPVPFDSVEPGGKLYVGINITSQDGSKKDCKYIEIERKKNDFKDLSGLTVNNTGYTLTPAFSASTTAYTLSLPADATSVNLTATWPTDKNIESVKIGSTALSNGSNTQYNLPTGATNFVVTVKAQDGSTKDYTVTLNKLSTDASLTVVGKLATDSTEVNGTEITPSSTTYTKAYEIRLADTGSQFQLKLSNANGATITIGSSTTNVNGNWTTAENFDSGEYTTRIVTVKSQAQTSLQYEIKIKRLSSAKKLDTISFTGGTIEPVFNPNDPKTTSYYEIKIPTGTTSSTVTGSATGAKVRVQTTDVTLDGSGNFSHTITSIPSGVFSVTVYDESNNPNSYNFKFVTVSDNAGITLKLDAQNSSNQGITGYTNQDRSNAGASSEVTLAKFTVPYETDHVKFTLNPVATVNEIKYNKLGSAATTLTSTGGNFVSDAFGTSTAIVTMKYEIYVTTQAGNTVKYTIELERQAASGVKEVTNPTSDILVYDNTGAAITVNYDSTNKKFTNPTEVEPTVTGVKIKATLPSPITGATYPTSATAYTSGQMSGGIASFNSTTNKATGVLEITAQDGTTVQYTIEITRRAPHTIADANISFNVYKSNNGVDTAVTVTESSNVLSNSGNILDYNKDDKGKVTVSFATNQNLQIRYSLNGNTATTTMNTSPYDIINIPFSMSDTNGQYFLVVISAKAEGDSNFSTVKTIKVYRKIPSSEKELRIDDVKGVIDGISATDMTPTNSLKNKYEFSSENGTQNKFTVDATVVKGINKIYYTDALTNLKKNEYTPATEFTIGSQLYLVVFAEDDSYTYIEIATDYKDERNTESGIQDIQILKSDATPAIPSFAFNENSTKYPSNGAVGTSNLTYMSVAATMQNVTFKVTLKDDNAKLADSSDVSFVDGALTSPNAKVSGSNNTGWTVTLNEGNNVFAFCGKAENDTLSSNIYYIYIWREPASTVNTLDELKIGTDTVKPTTFTDSTIQYCLPRTTSSVSVQFKPTDSNSEITVVSGTPGATTSTASPVTVNLNPGQKSIIQIKVRSEKGIVLNSSSPAYTRIYNIELYAAEQTFGIDTIDLLKVGDSTTQIKDVNDTAFVDVFLANQPAQQITTAANPFIVPYGTSNVNVSVTRDSNSQNAVISGDYGNQVLNSSGNTFNVTIESEYASLNSNIKDQQKIYTFTIKPKAADTNNYLKSLVVTPSGSTTPLTMTQSGTTNTTFDKTITQYKIENVDPSVTSINILGEAEVTTSVVIGNVNDTAIGSTQKVFFIYCQSQADVAAGNQGRKYEITISYQQVQYNTESGVSSIKVLDGATDLINYQETNFTYGTPNPIEVAGTVQSLTILAQAKNSLGKIKLTIDGDVKSDATDNQVSYILSLTPGQTYQIKVQGVAQDSNYKSQEYVINLKVNTVDTDPGMGSLSYDGNPLPIPSSGPYVITKYLPNSYDGQTVTIKATALKGTSIVTGVDSNSEFTTTPLSVGENSFTFTVKAEDRNVTRDYTVKFIVEDITTLDTLQVIRKDNNTDLIGTSFDKDTTTYPTDGTSYTVPFKCEKVELKGTTSSSYSITGLGLKDLNVGTNTFTVEIAGPTNGTGAKTTYTIKVEREAGKTDNYITEYTKEGTTTKADDWNISNASPYVYVVDPSISTFNPSFKVSDGATGKILETNRTLSKTSPNYFTIRVTSESGDIRDYNITVYRTSTNFNILNIRLTTNNMLTQNIMGSDGVTFVQYDKGTYLYELTVPYTTSQGYLFIRPEDDNAKIYVNNAEYTNSIQPFTQGGDTTFDIYCVSPYGVMTGLSSQQSPTYTIVIHSEPLNDDPSLKELHVWYQEPGQPKKDLLAEKGQPTFDPDAINPAGSPYVAKYVIENIGDDINQVTFEGVPRFAGTTVSYPTNPYTLGAVTGSGANIQNYVYTFDITATAESGKTYTYNIWVSRGPLNVNEDCTLELIRVTDSRNITYVGNENDNPKTKVFKLDDAEYNVVIPFGAQSCTIDVLKPNYSPATIFGSGQITITPAMWGTTISRTCYVQSQTGTKKSNEYVVNITFEAPDDNAYLEYIKIDGNIIPGFVKTQNDYTISGVYPFNIENVKVTAKRESDKSTMSGDCTIDDKIEIKTLNVGDNTIIISVQAQDTRVPLNTYKVHLKRDYETPYLLDLQLVGETLLDENDSKTTFDKDVKVYHAIVPYTKNTGTIQVQVPNDGYITSCNGQTLTQGSIRSFDGLQFVENSTVKFTIGLTSPEGKTSEYEIYVTRRGENSTITTAGNVTIVPKDVHDLPVPKDIYTPSTTGYIDDFKASQFNASDPTNPRPAEYDYTVPNKVVKLDIDLTPDIVASSLTNTAGATALVYNNEELKVGLNKVVMVVTAEDGVNSRVVVLNVNRLPMAYDVNDESCDYKIENKEGIPGVKTYEIDLGKKKSVEDIDFNKYIKFDDKLNNITTEVITDLSDKDITQVVVKVTDGDKTEYVCFDLARTTSGGFFAGAASNGTSFWIPWILVGISAIILTGILISVNRDKYGKVTKKRKEE